MSGYTGLNSAAGEWSHSPGFSNEYHDLSSAERSISLLDGAARVSLLEGAA